MALSQSLQQKLLQKLSPQQIQLMKLLQVPTANLEERIKEELEENPALEVDEEKPEEFEESKEEFNEAEEQYEEPDGSNDEYENIDISEYVHEGDDDIADYKLRDENYPDIDEDRVIPHKVETSFYEVLLDQLGLLNLDDREKKIAEQIVGSIDEDGYLRRDTSAIVDDLAFRQNIESNDNLSLVQNLGSPRNGLHWLISFRPVTQRNHTHVRIADVHLQFFFSKLLV